MDDVLDRLRSLLIARDNSGPFPLVLVNTISMTLLQY